MRQDEISGPVEPCIRKDVFNEDALPYGIQLGPRGHTVNILGHLGLWQGVKLAPVPHFDRLRADFDGEFPISQLHVRRRPRRENRKILHEMLTWWNPTGMVAT